MVYLTFYLSLGLTYATVQTHLSQQCKQLSDHAGHSMVDWSICLPAHTIGSINLRAPCGRQSRESAVLKLRHYVVDSTEVPINSPSPYQPFLFIIGRAFRPMAQCRNVNMAFIKTFANVWKPSSIQPLPIKNGFPIAF